MEESVMGMAVTRRAFGAGFTTALLATPAVASAADCEPIESGVAQLVTMKKVAKFAPNAPVKIISAIVDNWGFAAAAGMTNPLVIAHFFATLAAETGGLTILEENLNYSAKRLRAIFKTRVTEEQAQKLARRPIAIANHVYARPNMGNTQPGDGWKYRGSGFIQLTFKNNFKRVQALLQDSVPGLNIVDFPDTARDPAVAFKIAVAFWKISNASKFALLDDVAGVRKKINGGANGLDVARTYLVRAKSIFKPGAAEAGAYELGIGDFISIYSLLKKLDFIQKAPEEAFTPADFSTGVATFQTSVGLPETGFPDNATIDAIALVAKQNVADSSDTLLDIDARIALEPATK